MSKLDNKELVELVKKIMEADCTEEEHNELLCLLEENVPDPEVSDLIYYHEPELTAEEVVEKALEYKPIQL